ncbi:hypothetical protein SPI02_12020 [Staphylococcus piscifermentans]|uniref:Uncharacterized protein n=1 Tax=Staphylococcus piscifermentans TaxID=70258 RepID=A0A512QMF1_9STAP|nr:hypothetical protein SPI02_12020 [Staphylococcus piscifermentans]
MGFKFLNYKYPLIPIIQLILLGIINFLTKSSLFWQAINLLGLIGMVIITIFTYKKIGKSKKYK